MNSIFKAKVLIEVVGKAELAHFADKDSSVSEIVLVSSKQKEHFATGLLLLTHCTVRSLCSSSNSLAWPSTLTLVQPGWVDT